VFAKVGRKKVRQKSISKRTKIITRTRRTKTKIRTRAKIRMKTKISENKEEQK